MSARRAAAALALLLLVFAVAACGGDDEPTTTGLTASTASTDEARPGGQPEVQTIATGLEVPWEIAFLPDDRALVTERPGRVRLLGADGEFADEPVAEIDVQAEGEGGLLGLVIDPAFEDNRFVYLYFTTAEGMKLERYSLTDDDRLTRERTILEDIDAGPIHDSGRIAVGPDDRLYVLTGDAGQEELAQDPDSRNGKVLRLDPEQYRGEGGDPEFVSRGHRNPQGIDWEPRTDRAIATEHGPTGDDEINAIEDGANYGWPEVTGRDHGDFTAPLTVYADTIAPSGSAFVDREGSAWTDDYLVAALAGEQLRRLTFDGEEVTRDEPLFEGRFGRLRTVVEGPDGALYVLTSNRDGRGDPTDEDDRILRIVPPR